MSDDAAAVFDPLRPQLTRVAYRMLGSVADAEDVVQDAFLRWLATDRSAIVEPEAFLRRVVTRLCLDQLKSARVRRETYVGEWLPEPVVEEADDEDVTLPLMLALERLSPLERAAFLLHEVFGEDFETIAETLGRDAAACRQLAARARVHVREARPRYKVEKAAGLELAAAFFSASRDGDMARLRGLLTADVSVHSDGGGKVRAGFRPVLGVEDVMKLHASLARFMTGGQSRLVRFAMINGLPGFVSEEAGGVVQTTALEVQDGRVAAIYVVRNPDKLRHVAVH
ncbi:sigma-70 family RNA polymerase sigma factor [Sphingomonas sp.]|uniref:sigma-70 family RNA polymerase sigma factor n=1 Tax=Sphingomonas sp. TaxID=28214 RepID=UPI001B101ABB|nr:sigma-70 family RNA polymerase sigma factor [Sphingomonas sp.]MBO9712539.1 sigma-70 family RNA polymerase sigma factor [Sphingomonas sp.]